MWILFGLRAFAENFVETGSMRTKSKFDIGPVTTIISNNFVDNWRFRLSGRTTANLCNHFFWNGYYAYGTKSKNHYYGSEFTYSLNAKKNVPFEFPQRNIIFETGYDVMSPADKFLIHNKDNMFMDECLSRAVAQHDLCLRSAYLSHVLIAVGSRVERCARHLDERKVAGWLVALRLQRRVRA